MIRQAVRVILAALGALIVLVAAAFAWVAIYSHLIEPGHDVAYYRQYAQQASPWVALTLGMPVYFAACRWITRTRKAALAVFGVHCLIEIPMLATSDLSHLPAWFVPLNFALKFAGCYFGGRQ